MKRVLILTNGPGELWCWVRPVVPLLKEAGCHVTVRMLPCQYATGQEQRVALDLGADCVVPAGSSLGTFRDLWNEPCDLVLQMGGDLLYGFSAARKRTPLICYSYGRKSLMSHAERFITAWPQMVPEATDIVGDLVADAMQMDKGPSPWEKKGAYRLALFPGSRRQIRDASLGFLKEFREFLDEKRLSVETLTVLSPFAEEDELDIWSRAGLNPVKTGAGVVLKEADLAVTQPGTNTLELLHAGVPAIVAVPFSFLRQIPLSGIKGLVESKAPGGGWLKEKLLRHAAGKQRFVSWPNRLAGRKIMTEATGDITPKDLADMTAALLKDPSERSRQRRELMELSGGPGAAVKVTALVSAKLYQDGLI